MRPSAHGTPSWPGSASPTGLPCARGSLPEKGKQEEGEEGRGRTCRPGPGEEEPARQEKGRPPARLPARPYRSVFAQLAEGREGLLVRLAHLLDELPDLGRQRVALGALGLGRLLLLLVSVVPHSCGGQRPAVRGQVWAAACPQPELLPPALPAAETGTR